MTGKQMVADLVSTFAAPPQKMIDKMESIAESIPEDRRQDIIDAIVAEEGPSTKIGVKHMIEACTNLQVSYHKTTYMPSEPWTCDACGFEFQYVLYASDDDKIDKNVFDICPNCRFQPAWTIIARGYKELGGWYSALIKRFRETDYGCWSREAAVAERRDVLRLKVEQEMAELAAMRKWPARASNAT